MLRKLIFMLCFILAVMALIPALGQCENWKEFYKDGGEIWQYDKDSIHYPEQKKNIFGITVRDKNIVNVWIRIGKSGGFEEAFLTRIYCIERKCSGWDCDKDGVDIRDPYGKELFDKLRDPIKPGSKYEILLKKVCP
jgi:hypothetical protein